MSLPEDVRALILSSIAIPVNSTRQSNCNATVPIWYYERAEGSEA